MIEEYGEIQGSAKPTPQTVVFRKMETGDIGSIVAIEKECFTVPWTADAFHNELVHNHFAHYVVMMWEGQIIGYAGLWTIMDEAHVTNIAVREMYRGLRLGERLLREVFANAVRRGMKRITLEVRVSNTVAQRLYEKFGFKAEGLRRNYYSDNGEDAVIMWADLPARM